MQFGDWKKCIQFSHWENSYNLVSGKNVCSLMTGNIHADRSKLNKKNAVLVYCGKLNVFLVII